MGEDMEHSQVVISNNGPDAVSNVVLTVEHPLADQPYETSATCQPLPGPNPNGPALCPPGESPGVAPAATRVASGRTCSRMVRPGRGRDLVTLGKGIPARSCCASLLFC